MFNGFDKIVRMLFTSYLNHSFSRFEYYTRTRNNNKNYPMGWYTEHTPHLFLAENIILFFFMQIRTIITLNDCDDNKRVLFLYAKHKKRVGELERWGWAKTCRNHLIWVLLSQSGSMLEPIIEVYIRTHTHHRHAKYLWSGTCRSQTADRWIE